METASRRLPFGALACLILALFAFYPALTHSGLPQGADMEVHYWRTFEMDRIWESGEIIPRWGMDFHYGYGAPVFQFTAWGFYGLASLAGNLPSVDDVLRIKLIWFLGIYLVSYGTFRFVSRRWGFVAGLVSAASFIFAPAFIFGEPIGRGAPPVTLAMGFFAMSLALLELYGEKKHPVTGFLAAISIAGMMMAHNLSAFMGAGVIGLWLIWRLVILRESGTLHAFAIFILGGLLTAFFWLPVPFEQDIIRLERTYEDPSLDFRLYFQSLTTLLGPASLYDESALWQLPRFSLGVFSWILATIGLILFLIPSKNIKTFPHYKAIVFWIVIGLVSTFLVIPDSQFLWEAIPQMQIFQFPGRFLNFAAFGLALATVPLVVWLERQHQLAKYRIWGLFILLLIAQGLQSTPWRWVESYPADAQVEDYIDFEITTGKLSTTASGEFLSQDVNVPPSPQSALMNTLGNPEGPVRWATEVYPQATFTPIRQTPSEYAFRVETPERIAIEVFQFYFPGWVATVNGEPPPVVPLDGGGDHGFSWIIVLAGDNLVEFKYVVTDIQQLGRILSVVALVGLIGFLGIVSWRTQTSTSTPTYPERHYTNTFIGVILIAGMGTFALMREGIAWVKSPPGEAYLAQYDYDADFGEAFHLIGYDVSHTYQANRHEIALYWNVDEISSEEINSFVHIVDSNGQVVAQQDKLNFMTTLQTSDWTQEYYLRDVYVITMPENLPADYYRIRIGLWQCLQWEESSCEDERRIPVTIDRTEIEEGFIYLPRTIQGN